MSWERMGQAKGKDGLGFRDLECFNRALLAKQGWQLVQQPDSLVAQIMRDKYYPHGTFRRSQVWTITHLMHRGAYGTLKNWYKRG